MRYYLLNWEETGNPVPRIRNWMERLDYRADDFVFRRKPGYVVF